MSVAHVRGIEIAYDDTGNDCARAGAPVVVLLHGYPLNRSMWRAQIDELSALYRVVAPDLRGHGGTQATDDATTMEAMAQDVAALLDELRIERIVLGGLSMGGYVALAFYRLFPQRVGALVLADTRATPDTQEGRRGREESARKALTEGMQAIAGAMLPKLLAPATVAEMPDVAGRVRAMINATKPEGAASALRAMAVRRDQTDLLRQIRVPTLIIVGSEDTLTPPSDAEAMHRAIEGSRLEIIEGAGHLSNIERPSQFNRALSDFLNTKEGSEQ